MKFTTKEELIKQAMKDNACGEIINFIDSCESLQEIINIVDKNTTFWFLVKKYEQFALNIHWDKFSGAEITFIIRALPQFASFCNFDKLDGMDWARLLSKQPKFTYRCDWDKLNTSDLKFLLYYQPQLNIYKK